MANASDNEGRGKQKEMATYVLVGLLSGGTFGTGAAWFQGQNTPDSYELTVLRRSTESLQGQINHLRERIYTDESRLSLLEHNLDRVREDQTEIKRELEQIRAMLRSIERDHDRWKYNKPWDDLDGP